jgi:hypothetical protein
MRRSLLPAARRSLLPATLLVLATTGCKKAPPAPDPESLPEASAPKLADVPARCVAASAAPFVVGPADGKSPGDGAEAGAFERDEALPFATEVGDGVAWAGGFAVGAIQEVEHAFALTVVTMGPEGQNPRTISLGTAHGDLEPPRLAARGNLIALGVLSPEPNGRALRLGKIEDGKLTWGATVHQKGGESQAFDLAIADKKGIVVWDEDGPKGGVIQTSTFDPGNIGTASIPRTISAPEKDVESPRLLTRPGGYWLLYIAQRAGGDDSDAHFVAEEMGYRWIEIVALDANGSPVAPPRAVSPADGHVLVFDAGPSADGGAVVVFRDDDTPSGAEGGRVLRAVVHPGSIDRPTALVEEGVGAGTPNLLPGWLSVIDAADATRLAPLSPTGELGGALGMEPIIGSGEPVAGASDRLLVARPAGRAVKLLVVRCKAESPPASDR